VPYRRKKLTFAISSPDEFLYFLDRTADGYRQAQQPLEPPGKSYFSTFEH